MIIEAMVSGNIKDSDPQVIACANCLSQICSAIKDEFKQFLPMIVPQLIKDASRNIDLKVSDADDLPEVEEDEDEKKNMQSLQVKVKGMEGAK